MKKILYIEANKDGTIGGSYYSLLYLVQGLNRTKYEPHIMFFQDNILIPEFRKVTPHVYIIDFDPSGSRCVNNFVAFIKWPCRLFTEVILKQYTLKKIIDKIRPDLVHLNNSQAAVHEWILACRLNKIKVVSHDRGASPPYSFRTKIFMRLLDALICISDSYKSNVTKQRLRVKRLKRIYNGLDSDFFDLVIKESESNALKKKFHLQNTKYIVGIVGNIDRWKGQLVVLKAIKIIKSFYPDIKCLIIGKVVKGGEGYKKELDKYISDNGLSNNIVFTGFMKDIPIVLSILDILIHASIEPEPFGRVLLEGMAARKPIVATNAGGVPEIIINGETGILVPMNDPNKMAEAVRKYFSDVPVAEDMAEKGRQRLIESFSAKRMVEEIEKVYEDIFNNDKNKL